MSTTESASSASASATSSATSQLVATPRAGLSPSELPTLGNTLCSTRGSISALSAPPILSQMAQMHKRLEGTNFVKIEKSVKLFAPNKNESTNFNWRSVKVLELYKTSYW
ncbi:hypothetical protein F444_20810 [Phytophthora nicotianae P1976]|uniref:Uncharacterized protein n=1 Tax=Phytophthora nicotianae P1976 TaxID=1317066 RepID=A0A080Z3B9_PHYNI|nr:hypothetical protein F444_20810 [Phytophthora nicotianae P1976]